MGLKYQELYIIVFDLGKNTLNIALLEHKTEDENIIAADILPLGGNDFDNKLVDFCINTFCNATGHKEEDIRKDKPSCQRLKFQCEQAKKKFNIMKEITIELDSMERMI